MTNGGSQNLPSYYEKEYKKKQYFNFLIIGLFKKLVQIQTILIKKISMV